MGQKWKGGDLANGPGGAHKINLLKVWYSQKIYVMSSLLVIVNEPY